MAIVAKYLHTFEPVPAATLYFQWSDRHERFLTKPGPGKNVNTLLGGLPLHHIISAPAHRVLHHVLPFAQHLRQGDEE